MFGRELKKETVSTFPFGEISLKYSPTIPLDCTLSSANQRSRRRLPLSTHSCCQSLLLKGHLGTPGTSWVGASAMALASTTAPVSLLWLQAASEELAALTEGIQPCLKLACLLHSLDLGMQGRAEVKQGGWRSGTVYTNGGIF